VRIGGLQRFSLSDFPCRTSAVVFTQGCNFRCRFCHNAGLIPSRVSGEGLLPEHSVLQFLASRAGLLDGVVVSGGEPTIQPDVVSFLGKIKRFGLRVKLDTNGSRPDVLREVLREGVVDFIAMDVKAPLPLYHDLAGAEVDTAGIRQSISLIAGSGVPHEFRTTLVEELLSRRSLEQIKAMIPAGSPHRVQPFRREYALDPRLRVSPGEASGGCIRTNLAAAGIGGLRTPQGGGNRP